MGISHSTAVWKNIFQIWLFIGIYQIQDSTIFFFTFLKDHLHAVELSKNSNGEHYISKVVPVMTNKCSKAL